MAAGAYTITGIWDLLAHRVPNEVADNTTADVGPEHYYLYKQDFARLKALGIEGFSPSISWPRIFPFGKGHCSSCYEALVVIRLTLPRSNQRGRCGALR